MGTAAPVHEVRWSSPGNLPTEVMSCWCVDGRSCALWPFGRAIRAEEGASGGSAAGVAGVAADRVSAGTHSKLRIPAGPMTERMVTAVRNPHVDVLGHCTGRLLAGRGRPESVFDGAAVFAACREHGVAVEINCRPERMDPPDPLLRLADETGCLFAIDTAPRACPPPVSYRGIKRLIPVQPVQFSHRASFRRQPVFRGRLPSVKRAVRCGYGRHASRK